MLILTATQRLAHTISNPSVMPFDQWTMEEWKRLANPSITLLSEYQEHALWEMIIRDSQPDHSQVPIASIATMAREAWKLLKQWKIPIRTLFPSTSDTLLFKQWAVQFEKYCQKKSWLDHYTAIDQLIELIQEPPSITLQGFTDFNPQQLELIDVLHAKIENRRDGEKGEQRLAPTTDLQTEIMTMARWAGQLVQNNPSVRIACVVPNLVELRPQIEDMFKKVLGEIFTISATKKLHTYPLIQFALQMLNISSEFSLPVLRALVHSPFVHGAEQECIARATLYDHFQRLGKNNIEISSVLEKSESCPLFAERLREFSSLKEETTAPSQWSLFFTQRLSALGWPGHERWNEVLNQFASLDTIYSSLSQETALEKLQSLVEHTLFEPKKDPTPIQVLTPLETVGLSFDAIWIMGLQDTVWPPPPQPNPLLPIRLQREAGMPLASAEQTLKFHRMLLEQLCKSASTVIASYALHDQEQALSPSALLDNWPVISDLKLLDYTRRDHQLFHSAQLEWIEDHTAPALSKTESVKGGSDLFKQQAACPFRAFAHYRLGATSLPRTEIGLSKSERGNNVHKVLQSIWDKLKTHENLCHYPDKKLQQLIQNSVAKTLPKKGRIWEIEAQRLQHLISEWLTLEKTREPFTVIATEKKQQIRIANLEVNIRIDRIDQLSDGSWAMIDYKTGKISSRNIWQGDRPDEPQVPLYCIGSTHPVGDAFLAQLKSNIVRIERPNTSSDWQQQMQEWKVTLENLAHQFQQGDARVDPKTLTQTCRYCELSMLCRISDS